MVRGMTYDIQGGDEMKTRELIEYLKDIPNLMECDEYEKRLHEEIIERLKEHEILREIELEYYLKDYKTVKL